MGKREDILLATLDLISEEGLQSTTFSKIFKRANVGSGTVYNYYKCKEELVVALYSQTIDLFSKSILYDYDRSKSVYECFRQLLINTACFAQNHQKELWFLENYSHSPYIPEEVGNQEIPAMAECMLLIQRAMKQKLFRNIEPLLCVQMINGMVTSAIQGQLLGKYPMLENDFEKVIEICWRAFII